MSIPNALKIDQCLGIGPNIWHMHTILVHTIGLTADTFWFNRENLHNQINAPKEQMINLIQAMGKLHFDAKPKCELLKAVEPFLL